MRMSQQFSQTLRDAPADAQAASHQLLVRSGMIRQLAAGIFAYLPLARRSLNRIETILREEMNGIGGQELTMPVVLPADLWKETGRWYKIGAEMGRLKDRGQRDLVLAMTHEEAVGDLVRREIQSYRQLPQLIYQIQTKFRDDPRPRAGLVRVREFAMKDSYSLDRDWEGLELQYRAHYQAYFRIFQRCGLPVIAVNSDTGMMGGKLAHEFMYLTPIGEDTLILCPNCGYAANRQIASFAKHPEDNGQPLPMEKVSTPGTKTIDALAQFLGVPASRTAKVVFLTASMAEGERLVMAVVRGDMELNETKLTHAVDARELRPSTEEEISAAGAVAGFASPVGLNTPLVVVDDLIPATTNLVSGANQADHHLLNVNYGRDYTAQIVADITAAAEGSPCPHCGQSMQARRGIEVGNIFQLGTFYSDSLGCTFLDEAGAAHPVIMGSYGIGLGRLLACVAEEHHDGQGLRWPISVAPYPIHLVLLGGKNDEQPRMQAEALYARLVAAGVEPLFDDRTESPGVKFNDADLIGLPLRITIGQRSLAAGGVEFKLRDEDERRIVPLETAVEEAQAVLRSLEEALEALVVAVPYPG